MKKIFAIVVLYNAEKWIEPCFSGLLNSSMPLHILAIDNASSDGTIPLLQSKFPAVKLFESKKNLGFGQANNIGMRYALEQGADFVFLLNQDASVEAGSIETLVDVLARHTEYGILSPLHLDGTGRELEKGFYEYLIREPQGRSILSALSLNPVGSSPLYPYSFINAAAWLISRACMETIGGFDPVFFHYGEDVNYCQRLNYHGLKLGVCTSARVIHDRGISAGLKELRPSIALGKNFINFLTKISDINASGVHYSINYIRSTYKTVLTAAGRFDLPALGLSVSLFFSGLTLLPAISRSRAINRTKGPHYLTDLSEPGL